MDTREKMILESSKLFSQRGYDAVGVQEIVQSCDVTKPTLYHHFGNKLGLLKAIFEEKFGDLRIAIASAANIQQTSNYHLGLNKNLQTIASNLFEYARKEPEFYRMQLSMFFAPPENESHKVAFGYFIQLQEILEKMFQEAVLVLGNLRGKERIAATTFLGMVNNYIGLFLNHELDFSEDLTKILVHQFMHGISS